MQHNTTLLDVKLPVKEKSSLVNELLSLLERNKQFLKARRGIYVAQFKLALATFRS